ncbi:MAG: glycosyl hydrolase family 28-related protein, partial [Verrucomicrobiota bacterium]
MNQPCWVIGCLALGVSLALSQDEPAAITFPEDAGLLDVTSYGAVPNDGKDDTNAIQAALDSFPGGNRIVYLPPGVYHLSDTLRWPEGEQAGQSQKRVILQGAGETLSILRLPNGTSGFSGTEPKPLIWTGRKPAQRFRNAIR